MATPLDEVLQAARAALEGQRQDALDRVATLRSALDAYAEAVEVSLAAEVAAKLGVQAPPATSSANDAAAIFASSSSRCPS